MVNHRKYLSFIFGLFLCFSLIGCDAVKGLFGQKQEKEAAKGPVLAKIDDYTITLEDFNKQLDAIKAQLPADQKARVDSLTLEDKKSILDELVNRAILVKEAKARGLDKKSEVKDAAKEFERELLSRQMVSDITKDITVESKDVEDLYNALKDRLREPTEIRVQRIIVDSYDDAKQILIRLLQGEDFAKVAKESSKDSETAAKGGDLGFIKEGASILPDFDKVAFDLNAGEVSNIFKGPKGYYIFKIVEKKTGKIPSLTEKWDEVKEAAQIMKQGQEVQKVINEAKKKSKVVINDSLLK